MIEFESHHPASTEGCQGDGVSSHGWFSESLSDVKFGIASGTGRYRPCLKTHGRLFQEVFPAPSCHMEQACEHGHWDFLKESSTRNFHEMEPKGMCGPLVPTGTSLISRFLGDPGCSCNQNSLDDSRAHHDGGFPPSNVTSANFQKQEMRTNSSQGRRQLYRLAHGHTVPLFGPE
jgi:hypothetical protein